MNILGGKNMKEGKDRVVDNSDLEIIQVPKGYRRKDLGVTAVGDKIWDKENGCWADFLLIAFIFPTISLGMKVEELPPAVMIIEPIKSC